MVASSKNLRVTMLATPKLYIGVKLRWLVHRISFQIETVGWHWKLFSFYFSS